MTMKVKVAMTSVAVAAVVVLATVMITATTYGLTNSVLAQGPPKFVINLTGSEEVPPVQTEATGIAEFKPMGMDSVDYSVNATNIQGATAGHVHLGAKGENGPIVVTLFKYDTPMNEVSENGTITADKLEGPLAGKQISDLAAAGTNGTLYVNVHTEQNPNGEIRGGNTAMQ
jgi:CHRD domain